MFSPGDVLGCKKNGSLFKKAMPTHMSSTIGPYCCISAGVVHDDDERGIEGVYAVSTCKRGSLAKEIIQGFWSPSLLLP